MPESEFHWRRWTRDLSWKRDIVELALPLENILETVGFVEIHLRVNLRYPENEEGIFEGITVSGLHGKTHYLVPTWPGVLQKRRLTRYRDAVTQDVVSSLKWFDDFSTPEQCLKRLESGESSVGPIKEKGAAKQAFDFLKGVNRVVGR